MMEINTIFVLLLIYSEAEGYNLGVSSTKCSLQAHDYNNPCASIYNAICDGSHCKCPAGTHENKSLKTCTKGTSRAKPGKGNDDLGLPLDYVPGGKNNQNKPSSSGNRNQPGNQQPVFPALPPLPHQPKGENYPNQPAGKYDPQQPGGRSNKPAGSYPYDPSRSGSRPPAGYPYPANNPGNTYPVGYPNQPNTYPHQPGDPNQANYPQYPRNYPYSPGGNPTHPGSYPNQPAAGYPNQGYPQQPGSHPHKPNGRQDPYGRNTYRDSNVGAKAGGGVGGFIGLFLLLGILYFCCCRGEKGKNFMSKLPFRRGGNVAGNSLQMQAAPPPQNGPQMSYMPTDQQQPYAPPPAGFQPAPPPYSTTYQPTAAPAPY